MTEYAVLALAFTAAFVLAALATRVVLPILIARQIIDIPNERSSHVRPVPRGGGLGVMVGLVVVLALVIWLTGEPQLLWFGPGLALLVFISWRDDKASQPASVRLAFQFTAVSLALVAFPPDARIVHGLLPFWADRFVTAIAWIWFINLTNFMDGLDGMTGIQMSSIGLGIVAVALSGPLGTPTLTLLSAALAGAALGFLVWNWHPARVFLGDVGSVPLGFIAGGLLIVLSASGGFWPAIILPLYYVADATITLFWRMARGEHILQGHRSHWYQIAAAAVGHRRTVLAVLLCNVVLIAAAVFALWLPGIAALFAVLAVALLLGVLSWMARARQRQPG